MITDFGTDDRSAAVTIQPDGKLVAAGRSGDDFALARYNADGSLDPTFGSAGKVTTDFGGRSDFALALILQLDGKIVAAGFSSPGSCPPTCENSDFALARYNPDGSLDPTFGSGGIVLTDFRGSIDSATSLALQADGKIVVAGSSSLPSNSDFALARYLPDWQPRPDLWHRRQGDHRLWSCGRAR